MQLGFEVRLPTESEWQQAATGGHMDRAYPWGSDWGEGCANTCEGRLRRTTVVGLYPRGASAQGALDLAGNVWEWCLNRYDKPDQVSLVGARDRAVRGGSWAGNKDFARCTYRGRCSPEGHIIGFRLAGSPSLLGTQIAQDS
jgi:formylglycine-generating enzyme required for sulfatase activity